MALEPAQKGLSETQLETIKFFTNETFENGQGQVEDSQKKVEGRMEVEMENFEKF